MESWESNQLICMQDKHHNLCTIYPAWEPLYDSSRPLLLSTAIVNSNPDSEPTH